MLFDSNGRAVRSTVSSSYSRSEPQPEAEARVREQLKSIDSLLDVRWFPNAIWNDKHKSFEGRYGLVCEWPQNDPRYQLFQSGEIEDNVDMLGWFCEDIHNATSMPVSVDSIEQKVIELLGKCDGERIPHSTRMREIAEKNVKNRRNKRQPITDAAQDVAEVLRHMVGTRKTATVERVIREISQSKRDD